MGRGEGSGEDVYGLPNDRVEGAAELLFRIKNYFLNQLDFNKYCHFVPHNFCQNLSL
jgi:hypothetical protein